MTYLEMKPSEIVFSNMDSEKKSQRRPKKRERDENDGCDIDYRRYDKTYPRIVVHSDSCNADRSIALCYNLSYLKSITSYTKPCC